MHPAQINLAMREVNEFSSTSRPTSVYMRLNDFKNRAASLRLTGAPDDWKLDTINFYLQQNFIGDEFYTYGDKV